MRFTKKAYENIIRLFLKDPNNCNRGKEYRLAKFMLNMIPDLAFWKTVKAEPVSSLTFFLTKENKSSLSEEYKKYIKLCNFDPSTLKSKEYNLHKEKIGEDNNVKRTKKISKIDFIRNGTKKEN